VNNLPKVVTQRHLEQDLNSRPVDRKPKRLTRCTTEPPDEHAMTKFFKVQSTKFQGEAGLPYFRRNPDSLATQCRISPTLERARPIQSFRYNTDL